MLVSDVSDETIRLASSNIEANNLQDRIRSNHEPAKLNALVLVSKAGFLQVQKAGEGSVLLDLVESQATDFDFVMCNPPFYSSYEDYEAGSSPTHRPKPHSINTGKAHEIIYEDGGEVGFVTLMVDESLKTQKKVK